MNKFALLIAAAFCLPVLGLTGCGGGGDNKVIEVTPVAEESAAEQEAYDKAMEEEMNNQPGN